MYLHFISTPPLSAKLEDVASVKIEDVVIIDEPAEPPRASVKVRGILAYDFIFFYLIYFIANFV